MRARALRSAGKPEEAAAELRKALATSNDRCELLYLLWDCQFVLGDRAAAHETLLEAKALADGVAAHRIAVAEASWLMSQGEYAAAVEMIAAVTTPDESVRAYGLSVRGVCEAFLGDMDKGVATLEEARASAHRSGDMREYTRAVGNLTFVLGSSGHHERSARIGAEALKRLAVQGFPSTYSAPIRYNLATSLLALGRWPELDVLEVPDTIPGNKAARILLCQAEARALRGLDPDDLVEAAAKAIDGQDALFAAQSAYTRAVAARAKGRHRAAVELCRETVLDPPAALTGGEVLRLIAEGLGAVHDLQAAGGRVTKLDDPRRWSRAARAAAGAARAGGRGGAGWPSPRRGWTTGPPWPPTGTGSGCRTRRPTPGPGAVSRKRCAGHTSWPSGCAPCRCGRGSTGPLAGSASRCCTGTNPSSARSPRASARSWRCSAGAAPTARSPPSWC
ncbi:hypothetical protein BBK82_25365 [Lentzea guizhouensis]|uniref:MalT-like TPR region domain-containing protein n=1 Tax=Lentzea guizhouensis TaxID=1586287 RepID=A0A1B2HMH6_9PSEU|nr:hypothetical protein [Lentzea guizhouensis]ANZ38905.1 hypothetical protein BBK82_25365 [Lentzea guizhouensis]